MQGNGAAQTAARAGDENNGLINGWIHWADCAGALNKKSGASPALTMGELCSILYVNNNMDDKHVICRFRRKRMLAGKN